MKFASCEKELTESVSSFFASLMEIPEAVGEPTGGQHGEGPVGFNGQLVGLVAGRCFRPGCLPGGVGRMLFLSGVEPFLPFHLYVPPRDAQASVPMGSQGSNTMGSVSVKRAKSPRYSFSMAA